MPPAKVLLLTSIMAPHRTALFDALARDPAIDLQVVFLARSDPSRRWAVREDEMTFAHRTLREIWRTRRGDAFTHVTTGLARVVREVRPQLVIAGGWDQQAYLEAVVLTTVTGRPVLLWVESTLRDRREPRLTARSVKRVLARVVAGIVVPGTASMAYVRRLGVPMGRIFVAPNAVDNALFAARVVERSGRSGPVRFLFVGRLDPAKGVLPLLDAWIGMRADAELTMIGNGALAGRVRDRVGDGRITNVRLIEHVDRPAIAEEFARADVFVLPSVSDPWGLVVNEAMASGLPIVTTSAPGAVDDLVVHGENGLVVAPGDPGSLAMAMEALARDPDRRRAMGARSAERIAAYTPEAWAAGMRNAVLATLQRAGSG